MTCHCIHALRAAPAAKDFARSTKTSAPQARTSTSLSWIMSGASPRTSRRCATRWVTSTIASPSSTRPCTCTSTRPAASSVTRRTTCTRRCGPPPPCLTASQPSRRSHASANSRPPLSLTSAAVGDSLRLLLPTPIPTRAARRACVAGLARRDHAGQGAAARAAPALVHRPQHTARA